MKDIVITGSGLMCSLGTNASQVLQALLSGGNGVRTITGFDATGFSCRVGAQSPKIDVSHWGMHPRDARIMEDSAKMLMHCAREAFHSSSLGNKPISAQDIGIFMGMGPIDYDVNEALQVVLKSRDDGGRLSYGQFYEKGFREIYPLRTLTMLNNIAVCQAAIHLNIQGENAVFSPHGDAGCQALGEGANVVSEGRARAVLAGGVSEVISPISLARGHALGYLNQASSSGKMACRPFSKARKGTVLGEGCGVLVLESRASAIRREVPFKAAISGYGASCERAENHNGPTTDAVMRAMRYAMEDARVRPLDIDLVIAHGDGSPHGDGAEAAAIGSVFAGCNGKVHVFSSKGALGNLLAGAGAVDTVLAVEMMKNHVIPGTLHTHPLPEDMGFRLVSDAPLRKKIDRVLINCRSDEGSCATLVVEALD